MRLPDNVTALRNFVERLMGAGITEKEIDLMTRRNPRIVMGIV
jgi:predicted metal-dependent phosphotriesterase family hydrolase